MADHRCLLSRWRGSPRAAARWDLSSFLGSFARRPLLLPVVTSQSLEKVINALTVQST